MRKLDAEPASAVGSKLNRWNPLDVLIVAEVSDETILADLTVKATIYGRGGYPEYWVVTPEVVYVHTEPSGHGYGVRREYLAGAQIPVPYDNLTVDIAELIIL